MTTRNVTAVTKVRNKSACLFAGTWCLLLSVITTLIILCCDYFSLLSVVSCAFCACIRQTKFGHHPHPLGYLCAKFRFFRSLHFWANPWRKIAYSIVTHPAYLMAWEQKLKRFGTSTYIVSPTDKDICCYWMPHNTFWCLLVYQWVCRLCASINGALQVTF